jgi:hypothetical protein
MGMLRRHDRERRAGPGHELTEGAMARRGTPAHTDRQVEVARRWRADGSLEAERLRLRERTTDGSYTLPAERPGCAGAFMQALGGALYVLAWPLGLWWISGSLWGAAAGVVIVAAHLAAHMP